MATYAFTTTATTFSLSIDGTAQGTWDKTVKYDGVYKIDVLDTSCIVSLLNPYYSVTIYQADTITLNGVTQSGDIEDIAEDLKDNAFFKPSDPQVYVALLTQSSTTAPTVMELQNSLGALTWVREAAGLYAALLPVGVSRNRVAVYLSNNTGGASVEYSVIEEGETGQFKVQVTTAEGGTFQDGWLFRTAIRIEAY